MKIILTVTTGVLAVGVTLYSGLMHGRIRHEFGLGRDLTEQTRLVESLPKSFGVLSDGRPAWVLAGEPKRMADEVVQLLECAGHFQASYRSTLRPEWIVQVLLMVGPSGPLLVHSPGVCYPAAGNVKIGEVDVLKLRSEEGRVLELRVMHFTRPNLDGVTLRVGYTFSNGYDWESPTNVRQYFAGEPFLYKLQLQTMLPSGYELTEDQDPISEFAKHFHMPLE